MAKKPKEKRADQHTVDCPTCEGAMVVPGDRYTDPARVCPTCAGAGVVPDADGA